MLKGQTNSQAKLNTAPCKLQGSLSQSMKRYKQTKLTFSILTNGEIDVAEREVVCLILK